MKRPASASCQDTSLGFLFEESAFMVGSVTPQRQSVQSSSTGSALAFSEIKSSVSSSFTDFISPALSQSPMEENVEELAAVRRRLWSKKAASSLLAIEDTRPDEAIIELPALPDEADSEPIAREDMGLDAADVGLDEHAEEEDCVIWRRFRQRYRRWIQAKLDAMGDDVGAKNTLRSQYDLKRMTLEQRFKAAKLFFNDRPCEGPFQRQVLEMLEQKMQKKMARNNTSLTARRRF